MDAEAETPDVILLTPAQVVKRANALAHKLGYSSWQAFESAHPDGVWEGTTDEIMLAMLIGMPWGD